VVNRGRERGEALAALLSTLGAAAPSGVALTPAFVPWSGDLAVPDGTDVLVNATSIGLYPDVDARLPLDPETLRGMVVADVIPNPPRTRLIRDAEARGCTVLDGLGMLVNQGVIAIRHWTGVEPDPAVMRAALEEALSL
jgi:shikimate dehydrogenase